MAPSVLVDPVNGQQDVSKSKAGDRTVIPTAFPNPSLQVTADHKLKSKEAPVYAPRRGRLWCTSKPRGSVDPTFISGKPGASVHSCLKAIALSATRRPEWFSSVAKAAESTNTDRREPGDRVAVEPGVPCEECFLCDEGRYNLCEDVQFAGVYPYDGTIQRYKVHPAKWLHKLPGNVSFAEGALLEPLSVVMHGIKTAGLSLGRGVVVCGAGPIGLIALAAARASGAHPVVVTDVEPGRLAFAKDLVPSCVTYQVDLSKDAQENARAIRALFGENEYVAPETVLECTGVESSVCTAAYTARRGGTVMVIGVGKTIMNNLPFMHISLAEIDLRFINRYRDTWPPAIACLSGGILDLKKLVSHVFPLEKAQDALQLSADPRNGSIKVLVVDDTTVSL
ncbi:Polyketide synthase enoylreductase [Penicillium riverlandense]|uniref:Polyketide synthase enoylreductase n=1 Tax=Penicillium riverlandense TaxID=1903569 RepID=UPI0025488ACC|nr:Polyketide synthase enoylreductase [Penicillium riverlandense]KAJ5815760.1 Polyketide synthase enoylreductase [Penicillium riverlandense]